MDYLCLQDTRQTKREGLAIANTIRTLLPPGTLIFQAPISKQRPTDPSPIGGQIILISHRWSHHANHWYQDPTQRGLLTGITLSLSISLSLSLAVSLSLCLYQAISV